MKLVLSIINTDDAHKVSSALMRSGYQVTRLSTTGGFLRTGNVTFLTGVSDEKVEDVIEIIRSKSNKRNQTVPTTQACFGSETALNSIMPFSVNVGGATVFVLNVEDFRKLWFLLVAKVSKQVA